MCELKFRVFDDANFGTPQIRHFNIYQAHFINHIEKLEIMQYTGLKDKNGKEIYEGDIIKKRFEDRTLGEFYGIGEVVFGKWFAGFTVSYNYNSYNKLERLSSERDKDGWVVASRDMEVIGNIYKNPSLMEGVPCE